MRLQGKRALITGGTSGIGLSTAEVFAANGARVALTGKNPETVDRLRERFGAEHLVIQSDAADPQAIDALCSEVKAKFGGLDILFANAGITGPDVSIENITEDLFDDVFDINVKGVFFLVQKALPLLADGASIILNASIAPGMGRRNALLYAASKSAVRTMARNISAELADRGIRCNAISPGPIDTPLWDKFGGEPEELAGIKAKRVGAIPTGRFGASMEVAQAVLFLASDESRYIVAADIVIDGGLSEIRQ
jgi:NAD(P)-dependent dehydrogenase (short-subunit alcohol dehydrogenase family)